MSAVYWILLSLVAWLVIMAITVGYGLYGDDDKSGVSPVDDETIR